MIANKLVNKMTEDDAKYIITQILVQDYVTFQKARKTIKNIGNKLLNQGVEDYLITKGYNKPIESEYLSKKM